MVRHTLDPAERAWSIALRVADLYDDETGFWGPFVDTFTAALEELAGAFSAETILNVPARTRHRQRIKRYDVDPLQRARRLHVRRRRTVEREKRTRKCLCLS